MTSMLGSSGYVLIKHSSWVQIIITKLVPEVSFTRFFLLNDTVAEVHSVEGIFQAITFWNVENLEVDVITNGSMIINNYYLFQNWNLYVRCLYFSHGLDSSFMYF